ncbi:MAG: hypothetical protein MI861_21675 [Pirellulales bacterium]|nr:hypothetical protein [Pirellulales bacterium]
MIARSYGQLGNRLFLYAHMIAAARHHGVSLANPCFAEYASLFPATADDLWCRYPRVSPLGPPPSARRRKWLAKSLYSLARNLHRAGLRRYPCHILRLRGDESCDLAGEKFAHLARHRRHLLTLGWLFRSEPLLREHAHAIREHFQIEPQRQARVDRLLASIRQQADYVVGVHIRHGDYATYLGGKYFFSTDQYVRAMRDIVAQLPTKRVAFLVCSNAPMHRHDFDKLNIHFGPGHMVEDMYGFAKTDLLFGPPSTYTGWASFMGSVPLVEMTRSDGPIDITAQQSLVAA